MNITEFQKSRFGLFIHWGIYAIPARGEWVRSNEEMKEEDYIPFANEFDPDLFNPHQWAKLAKKSGMIYAYSLHTADVRLPNPEGRNTDPPERGRIRKSPP